MREKNHWCKTTFRIYFCLVCLNLPVPVHKTALIDWVVIEFFTDLSLFIRRRITPLLQKCNTLQAAVIPDRWADCSCFLQSNMTPYCHYLILPSVIILWLTEKAAYLFLLSIWLISTFSHALPIHILISCFMCSILFLHLCTFFTLLILLEQKWWKSHGQDLKDFHFTSIRQPYPEPIP